MGNHDRRRVSPVPGVSLEGYTDAISVPGDSEVRFMVSGSPGEATLSLVRLLHGDPNPEGPGYREEPVSWGQPMSIEVNEQELRLGSYVEVPHKDMLNPSEGFTLALWFLPTLLTTAWHTLAAKWTDANLSYALFCAGSETLTAAISHDGQKAEWCTAREPIQLKRWQFAALTYDAENGELCLYHSVPGEADPLAVSSIVGASGAETIVRSPKQVPAGRVFPGTAPLLFGACPDNPSTPARTWAHFNGKIASPTLLRRALDETEVQALAMGADPASLAPLAGLWHLGLEVTGTQVIDVSGHGNHGVAVNAPTRAVTGPKWRGFPSRLYTDAPDDYDAMHFHEDDIDDAGWEPTYSVRVPSEAPSGIYAARLERANDRLFLPFVVRPASPRSALAVLVPTLTWQAYGSNRMAFSYTEDGLIDQALCLYNVHRDGSMVAYSSRHRPTRSWNPAAGFQHWGAHTLTANLYLIDWLEHEEFEYDVYCDQDLHEGGVALLDPYQCLVVGSHPEYYTGAMLDGLRQYLRNGGRIVYLGGNGFYWVTSIDRDRPHLIEVRKGGEGDFSSQFVPEPGESQHSTTLEIGGLWARRGRPPRSLVGVEHAANVYVSGEGRWGFERLPASFDPRYAFVFAGVNREEVIGDFGLNLGTAAGFEMDAVQEWQWDDDQPEPTVLARAAHPLFFPPRRTVVSPVVDLALTVTASGGAVFAAGSVTWTGSLSRNNYENNVSRITENVIRRFLSVPRGECILDS